MCNENSDKPDRQDECGDLISSISFVAGPGTLDRQLKRLRHSTRAYDRILVRAVAERDVETVRVITKYPTNSMSLRLAYEDTPMSKLWEQREAIYSTSRKPPFEVDRAKEGWPLFGASAPPAPSPLSIPVGWKHSNVCSVSAVENEKCVAILSMLRGTTLPKAVLPSLEVPKCPYPIASDGLCANPDYYPRTNPSPSTTR